MRNEYLKAIHISLLYFVDFSTENYIGEHDIELRDDPHFKIVQDFWNLKTCSNLILTSSSSKEDSGMR